MDVFDYTPYKILLRLGDTISFEKFCISPFSGQIDHRHIPIDIIGQIMSILCQQHHKSEKTCMHIVDEI